MPNVNPPYRFSTTWKDQGNGTWGSAPASNAYIFEADFDGGTPGDTVTEFQTPFNTTYSNDISGPDGSSQVAKVAPPFEGKMFGGNMIDLNYGEGDDLWIAWYQYFPSGFIFANGVNGDDSGSVGAIKWLRLQYEGNSERITLGIDATPSWTSGNALTEMQYDWIIGELMDWESRKGGPGFFYDDQTTPKIPLQQWHQVQMHVHLSTGDAIRADGDGFIRTWVNDSYLGQEDINTLPISGTSNLKAIYMGDYWNGGAPQTQEWYVDRVRIADAEPTTTDSGGRPYIAPIGT